jgi:hypothetical protein
MGKTKLSSFSVNSASILGHKSLNLVMRKKETDRI